MKNLNLCLTVFALVLISLTFNSFGKDKGEVLFGETLTLYRTLAADPQKSQSKEIWDTIAKAFYSVYENYPNSNKAPNSLFLSGKMYEEIGERFDSTEDFRKSIRVSRQFVSTYPMNDLADDAQIRVARIVEKIGKKSEAYLEYKKIVDDLPEGDMIYAAKNKLGELSPFKPADTLQERYSTNGPPKITKIRHWSTDNYTRVVIHVNEEMPFESKFLREDPKINKPPRLYVDIKNTKIDNEMYIEPVTRGLLEQIKFGRNTSDISRVVLYIKSFEDYKVFSLKNPYRIVMDIQGEGADPYRIFAKEDKRDSKPDPSGIMAGSSKKPPANIDTLRQALGLKIGTVVIDPGHGGHDPGAIGPSGLKEKDINLKIAKALKKKLEKAGKGIGIRNVHLTREDDRFIPLEERTAIAKKLRADLFISIHCNASRNRSAHGLETYILSFTDDKRSLEVAARENATTTKRVSDLKDIIQDYLLNSKIEESKKFAKYVQNSIYSTVSSNYSPFNNKGVKKAPFIVLIGADIPSILVETSFISNPTEEKRLNSSKYREMIATGIFSGIKQYASEIETAAADYN